MSMTDTDNTQSLLVKACSDDDIEAIKSLLQKDGASVDSDKAIDWTDSDGKDLKTPPIFIAVDFGHLEVVRAFVEHNSGNINLKDDNGYTPLQWASWNGHLDIVKYLIQQGAKVDEEGLDLAKEFGHQDVTEVLLQHVDVYSSLDGDEDAIMDKACRGGDTTKVRQMLQSGYDVQKWKDETGKYQQYSPMFMAVRFGHLDVVQVFAELGVEVEAAI